MTEIFEGIGFGTESGAIFTALDIPGYGKDAKTATKPPSIAERYSNLDWSPWGIDNLQPITMKEDIENCGVLSAGIEAKSTIAIGAGTEPFFKVDVDKDGKDVLEWCKEKEIHDWLDENNMNDYFVDSVYDELAYGWSPGRILFNAGRTKINRVERIDVFDARVSKTTIKNPHSSHLFLCEDWQQSNTRFDDAKHAKIPLLQEGNEIHNILERKETELAFIKRRRRNGRQNYANPLWYSATEWVNIARSVPEFKNAIFTNQITFRYNVIIHPKYWEDNIINWSEISRDQKKKDAKQKETYDRIDKWLAGKYNAGKSLFNSGFFEKATGAFVPYIQIISVDDKFKDGKLLPDSAAANSEILFALQIVPALIGAGQPGGAYAQNAGGSNVRESYLTQIMLMEGARKHHSKILNLVKRVNGWDKYEKDSKRLVFKFKAGVLTTLDTGKSTKNETVG